MGRPLNDRFFGNRNVGSVSTATDNGIGGQGIASVTLGGSNSGFYSQGISITVSNPGLPGGVQAVASVTVNTATGVISAVSITEPGSGYTTTNVVSITKPATQNWQASGVTGTNVITVSTATGIVVGMTIAGGATGSNGKVQSIVGTTIYSTVVNNDNFTNATNMVFSDTGAGQTVVGVLTTDTGSQNPSQNPSTYQANAIIITANTDDAGAKVGDIQKQVGSRRYRVKTADGVARVKLVASNSPAVGEAYILATDQGGATYWVTKLTARRATLVPRGDGSPQFPLVADGFGGYEPVSAGWVFSGAVANKTVVIQNA
jgi:hypothetical protein